MGERKSSVASVLSVADAGGRAVSVAYIQSNVENFTSIAMSALCQKQTLCGAAIDRPYWQAPIRTASGNSKYRPFAEAICEAVTSSGPRADRLRQKPIADETGPSGEDQRVSPMSAMQVRRTFAGTFERLWTATQVARVLERQRYLRRGWIANGTRSLISSESTGSCC